MKEVYIIVYLDLVGYSKNNEPIQISFFKKFQRELHHILYEDIIKNDCILIPTGDGMIIGIKNDQDFDFLKSINLVIEITKWAHLNNSELRSSIHVGDVNLLIDINKNKNIVGNTINDAARMLSGADNNSIIVSKSFYDKFLRKEAVVIGENCSINKEISFIIVDEDTIIDKHSFEHNVYNIVFIENDVEYGNKCKIITKYFTPVYSTDYPKKENLRKSFFKRVSRCTELVLFGIYHPNTPEIIENITSNDYRDIKIEIYYASDALEDDILKFFGTKNNDYKIETKKKSINKLLEMKDLNPKLIIDLYEYNSFFPFGFSMIDKDIKGCGFIHFSNYLNGIVPANTPYIEVEYKTNVYPPLYKFYKDYIENILTKESFFKLLN